MDEKVDLSATDLRQRTNYNVNRPVYTEDEFHLGHQVADVSKETVPQKIKKYFQKQCSCSPKCLKEFVLAKIPILDWMPKYSIREDLVGDILAGITVCVLNIPQSLAFALLATMPPIYGLYVAFFPILVYAFFGTSRQMAFGSFGVVSLMAGSAVAKVLGPPPEAPAPLADANDTEAIYNFLNSSGSNITDDAINDYEYQKLLAMTSLTLMIGLVQILLSVFHMGFVTVYLSTPLVRGFTTGAACYIFTSQIKFLFGLSKYIPLYTGPFSLVYTYIDIFKNIHHSNYIEVILSVCVLIFVAGGKYLADKYRNKIKFTMPVELFAIIIGTAVSYLLELEGKHRVDIAGEIPQGLPAPFVPPIHYGLSMIGDAISIAIVGFAVSVSMATTFAKKNNYEIDANQEMFAYGISNFVAGFFSCFVSACSLARMLVYDSAGGKTQFAAIVNCIIILIVLLALGPLFEALPKAVLGAIIVVALQGMFKQCADLPILWRTSKIDFAKEVNGIKVISSGSTLYYVNCEYFKNQVYKLTGVNPTTVMAAKAEIEKKMKQQEIERQKQNKKKAKENGTTISDKEQVDFVPNHDASEEVALSMPQLPHLHTIIIDCGTFNFIDVNGVTVLTNLAMDYKKIGIRVLLADCQGNVKETLNRCDYFVKMEKIEIPECLFVTVHDAILYATSVNSENQNEPMDIKNESSVETKF
ncbi:prestin-like [Saccoglossus kowalevskii]|uniref:Prestin-like n=1 Tax=Saccoglossus kowalevskii TaxID=10224 RepID=A0ABM0MLV3_SACKO|nr:PREDICTED: prestin-like [Saccoglossus kowalevskii]